MKIKLLGVEFLSKKEAAQCLGVDSAYSFNKLTDLDIAAMLDSNLNKEGLALKLQMARDEFRAKQKVGKYGV